MVTMVKVVKVCWKHILRRANPPFRLNLIIKIAEKKYIYFFHKHCFYQRLIKAFNDNLDLGLHISKIIKQSIIFIAKLLSTPCIYLCFWRRFHQTANVIRSRSVTKLGLKPFSLLIHTTLTSLAKISQILAHFHVCILAHFHTPLILLSCYLSGLVIVLRDQYWSWQYYLSFTKDSEFSLKSLFFECDRMNL